MTDWIEETYRDTQRFGLRVEKRLFSAESGLQRVEVVETKAFGRVLAIDGVFMTSERDEHLYHEMLVQPAMCTAPRVERVLIIGGGDGGSAREVLRHGEVAHVTLVEIDALVIEACKAHLPSLGAWDDPRLEVRIGDGIAYVKESDELFDIIILDGTDPVGPGKGLFDRAFYRAVKARLAPNGVFALQSESPFLDDVFYEIQAALSEMFASVHPLFGPVPLYCAGMWSFTWASDAGDPHALVEARAAAIEPGCRAWSSAIHGAALVAPLYVRSRLGS